MNEKKSANSLSVYALRRKDLINEIKQSHPQISQGLVLLFAGFERASTVFRQESSFFYYTGINEPAACLALDLNGNVDLYVPNCQSEREKWMSYPHPFTQQNAAFFGVQSIGVLGDACPGYQLHPFFPAAEYKTVIERIESMIGLGGVVFTTAPKTPNGYIEQRLVLERLKSFAPSLSDRLVDISPIIADMRRRKDQSEIEKMYKAVEITALAHEAAAQAINDGGTEAEVQAGLEYMFTGSGARPAFPTIVGGGKNSTILHYHDNNAPLKKGDVVVVDIGAELDHYCADITRTYPVSGVFNKRQKEVYQIVLDTQEYIAGLAKPGMWLSNKDRPEQSLNHLAKKYLAERGYGDYFTHGIGHYLGLDVHDVGDYSQPLREGDVITIEPGIYIPKENLGIRIEDNYWLVKDGVVCLSEYIPKEIEDIEALVQQLYADVEDDESDDDSDEYDG